MRNLRRNVENRCYEFLCSLHPAGAPVHVGKEQKGLFSSAELTKILLPLGPFTHPSGFQHNLRLSYVNLVTVLNGAYTHRGESRFDRSELTRAFSQAAGYFEWSLAQHAASVLRQVPEEELAISSQLSSLTINSSPQQTQHKARPLSSQARPAPAPSSAYPQSPSSTPPRRPTLSTAPPLSASSPPATPQSIIMSPILSPQAASSSQYRSVRTCTNCKQAGHSSPSCPITQCYKCELL